MDKAFCLMSAAERRRWLEGCAGVRFSAGEDGGGRRRLDAAARVRWIPVREGCRSAGVSRGGVEAAVDRGEVGSCLFRDGHGRVIRCVDRRDFERYVARVRDVAPPRGWMAAEEVCGRLQVSRASLHRLAVREGLGMFVGCDPRSHRRRVWFEPVGVERLAGRLRAGADAAPVGWVPLTVWARQKGRSRYRVFQLLKGRGLLAQGVMARVPGRWLSLCFPPEVLEKV